MQTFKGTEYLKIDIANSFGLDKKDWSERLQWYDDNEHRLISLLKDAENSAQFYAGYRAMQYIKMGKRNTGYLVSLDATSSGIQILSVLTGDKKAAELSNVVDTGRRRSAYNELFKVMQSKVAQLYGNNLQPHFIYEDLKQAIMTAFYGSEAVPKQVFGEGNLLSAFFKTLEEETPYVWGLNRTFLKMWDPTKAVHEWVMPDNFHVRIKVMDKVQETVTFMGDAFTTEKAVNQPTPSGRSIGANITHSCDGFIVRELVARCNFDPVQRSRVQQLIIDGPSEGTDISENTSMVRTLWDRYLESGYLSARILRYLDETNIDLVDTDALQDLLDSMPKRPFKVLPVHDCFKVHPNYGNDLRRQYNLQLSLIASSNMLSYLLSQFLGRRITVNKQANFASEVLHADYALS